MEVEYKIFPTNWFEESRVPRLKSVVDFEKAFKTNTKHLIVELYDPKCNYCYEFMEEFHKVYYYFENNYGEEQILFMIMDGTVEEFDKYIVQYEITHCPYLVYFAPHNHTTEKSG